MIQGTQFYGTKETSNEKSSILVKCTPFYSQIYLKIHVLNSTHPSPNLTELIQK